MVIFSRAMAHILNVCIVICTVWRYIYKEGVEQNGCSRTPPASNGAWTPNFPRLRTLHPVSILGGRSARRSPCRGARGEKPPNDRPPSWIYGENIRFSAHAPMLPIQKKNPNRCSRTPPANVDEKRPNVPICRTLYLTYI